MRYFIALLAVAGIVISSLALRVHLQDPGQAPPCAVSEHWDCGTVNHSRFATFPPMPAASFGEAPAPAGRHIPVATLGIIGYAIIAATALFGRLWITLQLAEIGFGFAAFLTYLEAFVIEKWCIYCVWSQVTITLILIATAVALYLQHRRGRAITAVAR